MLVMLKPDANANAIRHELLKRGAESSLHGVGENRVLEVEGKPLLLGLDGIACVLEHKSPHPLADQGPRAVDVSGVIVGGHDPVLIAGPCAVESEEQIFAAAAAAKAAGAKILRGGAFKPRSSPYSFRGLGIEGLLLMRAAADAHDLRVVTEVLSIRDVEQVAEHADLLQIGSRTMQAFDLLKEAGGAGRPVLLKRGMSATVTEWLLAAEHLFAAGAPGVILCERGIRTFAQPTRNTLDLGTVAYLLQHASLPIVVDPSHAAGQRELVIPLARAALAVGAHGVMVEVHPDPASSMSDARQALTPSQLAILGAPFRQARS